MVKITWNAQKVHF